MKAGKGGDGLGVGCSVQVGWPIVLGMPTPVIPNPIMGTEKGGDSCFERVGWRVVLQRPSPFIWFSTIQKYLIIASVTLSSVLNLNLAADDLKTLRDVRGGLSLCFAVLFAIMVVIGEFTKFTAIFEYWKILEYRTFKGFMLILAALLQFRYSDGIIDRHMVYTLQQIIAYMMLVCGIMYFLQILVDWWTKPSEMTGDQSHEDTGIKYTNLAGQSSSLPELTTIQAIQGLEDLEREVRELRQEQLRKLLDP